MSLRLNHTSLMCNLFGIVRVGFCVLDGAFIDFNLVGGPRFDFKCRISLR